MDEKVTSPLKLPPSPPPPPPLIFYPANDKTYLGLDVYSWGGPRNLVLHFKWPPCAQKGQPEAAFF